jgi:integrase
VRLSRTRRPPARRWVRELSRDPRHGAWAYRIETAADPATGQRRTISKGGFKTEREAVAARNKVRRSLDTHEHRDDRKLTVADWFTEWLARRLAAGSLRPTTRRMYESYVSKDLVPRLGRLRLGELTPNHVDRLVSDLLKAGRGPVTVRRIVATLSSALGSAKRSQLITINPAADVELPSAARPKIRVWQPEQLGRFLEVASQHRLGAAFEVAVFTGLRRGELVGLEWDDVDLERQVLVVRRSVVQAGRERLVGKAKTRSGEDRVVDIGPRVVGVLLAHQLVQQAERAAWGLAYEPTRRVFARENGEDLAPDALSRLFKRLATKAGLPDAHLHTMRHQSASLLLAAGTDIAVVSKRLGHATIGLTSDTYSHLIGTIGRRAAAAAEALIEPTHSPTHSPSL